LTTVKNWSNLGLNLSYLLSVFWLLNRVQRGVWIGARIVITVIFLWITMNLAGQMDQIIIGI